MVGKLKMTLASVMMDVMVWVVLITTGALLKTELGGRSEGVVMIMNMIYFNKKKILRRNADHEIRILARRV